tara:strand:+ start:9121 stop:9864 length:744 start_codon:yes stop_codon:yes gene_type:complete
MNYKIIIFFVLIFMYSCAPVEKKVDVSFKEVFSNSGFSLVYDNELNSEIVTKRIDDRSLIIFQKNLKPRTSVKIVNLLNNKSTIAEVGEKSIYPDFYNAVISKRIASLIEIDINEPYTSIIEIDKNSTFVAKKAKTFEEERVVAEKAPVDEIGVKDLNSDSKNHNQKNKKKDFRYVIKLADFYFIDSATSLKKRVKIELGLKNVHINKISETKFRVYLGPFKDLLSIQKTFNKLQNLNFENIEIIKV